MADHFIRQIKIARHFYISQYRYIDRNAKRAMKKNSFGYLVDLYIRSRFAKDMTFFETESGANLLEFLEKIVKIEEISDNNQHAYRISIDRKRIDPGKNELNIKKAAIEHEKARQMIGLHNNNALISVLVRFENFLNDYFMWLINKYPDKYLSEKQIKYSELLKFNYEELRSELAKEAANSIMSQPLNDWFKIIRSHKISLEIISTQLHDFTEIYYRRNLIVHNNGKINRQYLAGIKADGNSYQLGQQLITDQQYVLKAINTIMIIVYGILYASLKVNKEDKDEYLDFLFSAGFEHMLEEDWDISYFIFGLLMNEKCKDVLTNVLSQINFWISCKNKGQFEQVKAEIEATDYSAMSISVRMAKEILLENYETAVSLMDEAIACEMTPDVVETWPLFIQFRKTKYYKAFKEKYADRIEQQTVTSDDLESNKTDTKDMNILKDDIQTDSFEEKQPSQC